MDCPRAHQLLRAGQLDEAPEQVRVHLSECTACEELARDGSRLARQLADSEPEAGPPLDLAGLLDEVQTALQGERGLGGRLLALPTGTRVTLGFAVVAGLMLAVAGLFGRPDLTAIPRWQMAAVIGVHGAVILALLWQSLRSLACPQGRSQGWILASAIVLPWLMGLVPRLSGAQPLGGGVGPGHHPILGAAMCFAFGSVLAASILLVVWRIDRAGMKMSWQAVTAAAVGGLGGSLGLHLHCPSVQPVHIFAGHASVSLVLVVVFARVGRWLPVPRS